MRPLERILFFCVCCAEGIRVKGLIMNHPPPQDPSYYLQTLNSEMYLLVWLGALSIASINKMENLVLERKTIGGNYIAQERLASYNRRCPRSNSKPPQRSCLSLSLLQIPQCVVSSLVWPRIFYDRSTAPLDVSFISHPERRPSSSLLSRILKPNFQVVLPADLRRCTYSRTLVWCWPVHQRVIFHG